MSWIEEYKRRDALRKELNERVKALANERDPVRIATLAQAIITVVEDAGSEATSHEIADYLLCAVLRTAGYGELVDAFEKLCKWYA